ncbi:MAG: translation elongation factor Ts [Acidimicrobiales bacterium]
MAEFTAKDVQALRNATGAGMMDAKRALTESDGDTQGAMKWLRERGLGKAAERAGRETQEGAVAVSYDKEANAIALVQLRSETDFGAKSPDFVNLVNELADAAPGDLLDSYLHVQNDRGVNAVIIELAGGSQQLAHDIAVHIAFGRPKYLRREDVPAEEVDAERATLEAETRRDGKPEAQVPKIVDGKLGGWFKRVPGGVLLEQPFAKDDSKTVLQTLGDARIVRYAQVVIGG